jgi:hypothetical protein
MRIERCACASVSSASFTVYALQINNSHSFAARGLDSYATPPEAVRALMRAERLPKFIVDPCCGAGSILDALKKGGHFVHGWDIVDRGWPHTVVRDYFSQPMRDVAIVANPPFKLALAFVRKAIADKCIYHAWLLRTNFLESMTRKGFFEANPPTRLHIFSRRLPMMHREDWTGPKAASNMAYAWYVWDRRNDGDGRRQLNWLDWAEKDCQKLGKAVR